VLVYPAWLVEEDDPARLIEEIHVNPDSPPMFFANSVDDSHTCMNSVTLFGELIQHNVDASLHVFVSGGHGFGGRVTGEPTDAWRELCGSWLRGQGWLKR
jgi:hypothetical protein